MIDLGRVIIEAMLSHRGRVGLRLDDGREGDVMRRVRNYDAELKALDAKARVLKAKKIEQLGQLVTACGADVLDTETLAGVLIAAVRADAETREAWRAKGSAYFQQRSRKTARRAGGNSEGASETGPGETPR
jgi:hypothetical protein